jgi:hypothetical protein
MRSFVILFSSFILPLPLSAAPVAAPVRSFTDGTDTTLHIRNTVNAKALVVDAGMGLGVEATGDLAMQAHGSRVGLRAEAEYYGIEAVARNGSGIRATGSTTGVSAEGGWGGLTAAGGHAGVVAAASEAGGVGVKGSANSPRGIGVWGDAGRFGEASGGSAGVAGHGSGERAVGVSGLADGKGGVAVMGSASGEATLAGLFHGDVVVLGDCHPCVPADPAFQPNPRPLDGALAMVLALKPRTYGVGVKNDVKNEGGKNKDGVGDAAGPSDPRYGFSAQEVHAVLPGVVHAAVVPARPTSAEQWNTHDKGVVTVQTMNYQELIPILVRAIQEQQAEIEILKRRTK